MPPARVVPLLLSSSHSLFIFRSPASRYAPLTSVRGLRRAPHSHKNPKVTLASSLQTLRGDQPETKSYPDGVNLFESDEETPNKRRRITGYNAQEGVELDSFKKEVAELERSVKDMEREMKEKEKAEEDEITNRASWMTDGDRSKLKMALRETMNELDGHDGAPDHGMPHRIQAHPEFSRSAMLFVRKLNEALDAASVNAIDPRTRQALWLYYERGKIYVPGLLKLLPDEAWQLIWSSQMEEFPDNQNRSSHLKTLGQDMAKAGRALTEEQRFARLEGLFWEGKPNEALEQFERGLSEGDGGKGEYLEMGIRMYSYDRNFERVGQLLDVLFNLLPTWNPRVLIPPITARIGRGQAEDATVAWKLYQRFRSLMGSETSMEDYDQISLAFLRSGYKDHALAVFRDMMLQGQIDKTHSSINAAIAQLNSFISSGSDSSEVNSLGLQSLAFLPPQYQNKFFYASWMKKLIGMGEIRAAAQVLELMQERGVRPDAKHINGLINGWFRSGDKSAYKEAETIAWSMIQSRLDFVAERRKNQLFGSTQLSKSIHEFDVEEHDNNPQVPSIGQAGDLPPATIETFSLLVQFYLRRSMFDNVRHLRNLLAACEIPLNSYFMNHLLYAELRNRSYEEAWTRFLVMSQSVQPDVATFTCLWECMKVHVDPVDNPDFARRPFYRIGFPSPRELMHRMQEWFAGLQGQQRRDALADMDQETYSSVIRCFCLSKDSAGSFAAVHYLRQNFDLTPDEDTMRMLVLQIARLSLHNPKSYYSARKLTASKVMQENISRTTQVLGAIAQFRTQAYQEHGIDVKQMRREWQQEEQHRVALQLLYTVLQQASGEEAADDAAVKSIEVAAQEMGLGSIDVESAIALNSE